MNILGFDFSAFENIKIDTLSILGTGIITFLENSFKNSEIKTIKHSSTISLDIKANAFNNEFTEVVL